MFDDLLGPRPKEEKEIILEKEDSCGGKPAGCEDDCDECDEPKSLASSSTSKTDDELEDDDPWGDDDDDEDDEDDLLIDEDDEDDDEDLAKIKKW